MNSINVLFETDFPRVVICDSNREGGKYIEMGMRYLIWEMCQLLTLGVQGWEGGGGVVATHT